MRFAFRIGNHFGCSDGADEDLQGYDANFGALLDERYPFRVIRLPYNILVATRPSAVFPSLDRVGSYCAGRAPELPSQRRRSSLTSAPSRRRAPRSGARELGRQILERDRVVGKPPRLEDAPLALVEHRERFTERLLAVLRFLVLDEPRLLIGDFVDEPVLPFAGIAVVADRGVERHVAAEAVVHVDHVLLGHAEAFGDELDLVRAQVALFQRRDLALGLAQVEEQLLLVGGGAHFHQRPRAQDVFLDRRLDPPHGVGGETEAFIGLEALDRLHQADIALRNHFGDRQAVAAIARGDLGDEAQMTVDELVCRLMVAVLAPALGQHEFVLRFQHRNPPDFLKIAGDAGFGRHPLIRGRQPSHDLYRIVGTVVTVAFNYFRNTIICIYPHCQFDFETLLSCRGRPCQHAKRQSSCCWWGGLCKPRPMTANSAPPSGWRYATSPAPIRSRGPRRHLRSFKRPPAAPLRKRSKHLRQVGTWSDSDRRRTGEASVCD